MLNAKVLPNGNLLLTASNEDRAWIKEQRENRSVDDVLHEGLEHYWANGSYESFDAGDGDPFVGLTDAPCIAESMTVEDDGKNVIEGRFWYFSNYMITDLTEELKNKGRVVFTLCDQS